MQGAHTLVHLVAGFLVRILHVIDLLVMHLVGLLEMLAIKLVIVEDLSMGVLLLWNVIKAKKVWLVCLSDTFRAYKLGGTHLKLVRIESIILAGSVEDTLVPFINVWLLWSVLGPRLHVHIKRL